MNVMGNCKDEVVAAREGRSLIYAGEEGCMGPIYSESSFCISVQIRGGYKHVRVPKTGLK